MYASRYWAKRLVFGMSLKHSLKLSFGEGRSSMRYLKLQTLRQEKCVDSGFEHTIIYTLCDHREYRESGREVSSYVSCGNAMPALRFYRTKIELIHDILPCLPETPVCLSSTYNLYTYANFDITSDT